MCTSHFEFVAVYSICLLVGGVGDNRFLGACPTPMPRSVWMRINRPIPPSRSYKIWERSGNRRVAIRSAVA